MSNNQASNVLQFPIDRRGFSGCPQCGRRSSVWRIGRLAWAWCEQHSVRWVAADFPDAHPAAIDREQLRGRLEFLSAFDEIHR